MQAAEQQVEKAAREAVGDSHSEFIVRMDRRQSNPAVAIKCPTEKNPVKSHGALGVTADGGWLICGGGPGFKCAHRQGISRSEFEGLDRNGLLPNEAGYEAPRHAGAVQAEPAGAADDSVDEVTE